MHLLRSLNRKVFLIGILISIVALAFLMQSYLFVNPDVLWLLEVSKRLLAGGTYTNNFFENNPPLILYLYMPPVIISKLLLINTALSLRLYIVLLSLVSLSICYFYSLKIFTQQNLNVANVFTLMIAMMFLLLPAYDFGQREHLLIILTMPYLLLIISRLHNNKVYPSLAILTGLLAGLGFAIKPYFIVTLILIELYYLLYRKNIFAWVRVETVAIAIVFISYMAILVTYHHDYLYLVAPYALRWCYIGSHTPWGLMISFPPVLFCLLAVLSYLIQYRSNPYQLLSTVLTVALFGFLFSFYIQQTLYSYHLLPPLSLALLIFTLQVSVYSTRPLMKRDYLTIGILGLLFLAFLYLCSPTIWIVIVFNPLKYFYFFSGFFLILFYLFYDPKNIKDLLKIATSVLFVIVVGFWFSYMMHRTSWNSHVFSITTLLLILLFGLIAPTSRQKTYDSIFISLFAALIFSFPFYYVYNLYYGQRTKQTRQESILSFLQSHASHRSVYVFSTMSLLPLISNADNVTYASRFSFFWMLPALAKSSYVYGADFRKEQKAIDKNFLVEMVAEDLVKNKPDFVLVDVSHPKLFFSFIKKLHNQYRAEIIPFDYLTYFSDNDHFKAAWKKYHYVTELKMSSTFLQMPTYQFQVYERG